MPDDIRKPGDAAVQGLSATRHNVRIAGSAEAAAWRKENAEAIADWIGWIERNGMPLARYRSL